MKKVLIIVGPTASGKTSISVELAKHFNGEIISGDSIQQYKGLDIGSGKVTEVEKQGITHYLIDTKDSKEPSDVASFQSEAREAIDTIDAKGKLPIVCGGTGLYIKALLYDYTFSENKPLDDTLQTKLDSLSNQELYDWLMRLDAASASKIHVNNRVRLQRALTICLTNDLSKSEQENAQLHQPIYDAYIICLAWPRELLRQRISIRVDKMVNDGLVEEIENLLLSGVTFSDPCMKGIGYKEFKEYANGNSDLDTVINAIKTHSGQFAKRQETFFKHQFNNVHWIDMQQLNMDAVIEGISQWLK